MKKIVLLITLGLSACTKTPTSVNIGNSAKDTIDLIQNTLPPECRTNVVMQEITIARQLIDSSMAVCQSEKDIIQSESTKKSWAIAFLLMCLGGMGWLLLRKKF